jgi:hypothetical protein
MMTDQSGNLVLPDVPQIANLEYPDIFADALSVALFYQDLDVYTRCALLREGYRLTPGHRGGMYGAISTITGRGWLIGFDEADYCCEKYGAQDSHASFAVAGLEAYLEHYETLHEAVRFMDHVPEFLWNQDCAYPVDAQQAAGFIAAAESVDGAAVRRYVTEYLAARQRPVIALLAMPGAPVVEMALITGYEAGGATIFGRSPYQNPRLESTNPCGYFRMGDWEGHVLAILGVGEEQQATRDKHPCYMAMKNALKYARSYTCGTRHCGLAAYDAWERALLDDECLIEADDPTVARRLLHHSAVAGFIASQKAFTVLPECQAPSMGVISNLVRRASTGPGLIHGLMWDVWQVVGGYWRGVKRVDAGYRVYWDNDEEVRRFRDRAVRERAAQVVRRARQVDVQSLEDLQQALEEWDHCLGRGNNHPCPCMGRPCVRMIA